MGVLTQTMTRLHDEIVSASRSRQALRDELIRQTEERRSQDFRSMHWLRERSGGSPPCMAWPNTSSPRPCGSQDRKSRTADYSCTSYKGKGSREE